jgi:hypothetical protein
MESMISLAWGRGASGTRSVRPKAIDERIAEKQGHMWVAGLPGIGKTLLSKLGPRCHTGAGRKVGCGTGALTVPLG